VRAVEFVVDANRLGDGRTEQRYGSKPFDSTRLPRVARATQRRHESQLWLPYMCNFYWLVVITC